MLTGILKWIKIPARVLIKKKNSVPVSVFLLYLFNWSQIFMQISSLRFRFLTEVKKIFRSRMRRQEKNPRDNKQMAATAKTFQFNFPSTQRELSEN